MIPPPPNIASQEEYDTVVAWFALQLGLVSEELEKLLPQMAAQAEIAAEWQQLSMLSEVLIAGREAAAAGTTFEAFRVALKEKLEKTWSAQVDNNRLEAVFQTNMQRAQVAARVKQLQAEGDSHPFWKFSAIVDQATTAVCRASHNVVLPANHPWWKTHTPPLHMLCRSTIVALTERTAKQLGVADKPTELEPAEGFGDPASLWKPDLRTLPRVLVKARKKRDD